MRASQIEAMSRARSAARQRRRGAGARHEAIDKFLAAAREGSVAPQGGAAWWSSASGSRPTCTPLALAINQALGNLGTAAVVTEPVASMPRSQHRVARLARAAT